jgi:hypothetical protein
MKYLKLFEDFKVEDIPQTEPGFTLWIMKNAPKAVLNPQEWFEEEMAKPKPDWNFILYIIKEFGYGDFRRLPIWIKNKMHLKEGYSKESIDSFTFLHWAVIINNVELVRTLIQNGEDLNIGDDTGWRALHWATFLDKSQIVELLIDGGVDLDAQNDMGWTALHWAAYKYHREIVEMLIDAGADVSIKKNSQETPWDVADDRLTNPYGNPLMELKPKV